MIFFVMLICFGLQQKQMFIFSVFVFLKFFTLWVFRKVEVLRVKDHGKSVVGDLQNEASVH